MGQEVTYACAHRDRRDGHRDRRRASASVVRSAGGGRGASIRTKRPGRCRATSSSRRRPPSIPAGSPSTRRPRPSGRGWSRWASTAPAGTATTGSTCVARASTTIVPKLQDLAVGDLMPMSPERRLRGQGPRARSSPGPAIGHRAHRATGLERRADDQTDVAGRVWPRPGAFLRQTPQEFAASWAFSLEPLDGGRTRLIERFRVRFGPSGPGFRLVGPVMGFGVFVMMQRQMLGIRERALRTAVAPPLPSGQPRRPTRAPRPTVTSVVPGTTDGARQPGRLIACGGSMP